MNGRTAMLCVLCCVSSAFAAPAKQVRPEGAYASRTPIATTVEKQEAQLKPSAPTVAEKSAVGGPVNVIFDTDLCLDDDDGMALAIVHALQSRHEANLVAVTVSLNDAWCAPYADILNTFYGRPGIPIGAIRNGLSFKAAQERSHKARKLGQLTHERLANTFVEFMSRRRNRDGSSTYPHRLTNASQAADATSLLRSTLAAQPDGSVVMIQVGNSSNFAALLASRPDAISNSSGLELIRKKARMLSVMGGSFRDIRGADGAVALPKGYGINFYEDVASAQRVFKEWPTKIIVSGAEIATIEIPGISIERDFSYVDNHPIAEAYRYMCTWLIRAAYMPATTKCPHDHHTADLTATLYALRPDREYFSLSKAGIITVLPDGNVRFDEDENGSHRFLIANEEQRVRAQEAMTMLLSQPPLVLRMEASHVRSSNQK